MEFIIYIIIIIGKNKYFLLKIELFWNIILVVKLILEIKYYWWEKYINGILFLNINNNIYLNKIILF